MDQQGDAPAKRTTLLIVLIIVGVCAGIVLLVLLILVLKRYLHKFSCCFDCPDSLRSRNGNGKESKLYEVLNAEACRTPESVKSNGAVRTRESVDKYKTSSFYIPGKLATETVQPRRQKFSVSSERIDVVSLSDTRSRSGSLPLESRESPFFFDYPQLYSPLYDRNSLGGLSPVDDVASPNELGLPSPARRKSNEPPPSLGTISIQLQYEDSSNRSLVLTLQSIQNIAFPRPEIEGVYASVQLTPVREHRHISKQLYRNAKLNFNENFYFKSGASQRDFGSRTILITVICVEKSSKHVNYGEARVPLLNREIFIQVPANLQLPIQPISLQNEVGDVEISLCYSPQKSLLTVQVNRVRFPTARALEGITDLRIKGYVDVVRDKAIRHGKKQNMVKEIPEKTMEVEFSHQLLFDLSSEDFQESVLKFRIQGRQKFTRRILSVGKIQIGHHVSQPQGVSHWRVIQDQKDISWTMWHPIYTY